MSRFGKLAIVWLAFILAVIGLNEASRLKQMGSRAAVSPVPAEQGGDRAQILKNLKQMLQEREYLQALAIIDRHQSDFNKVGASQSEKAYQFYYLKGHTHSALWQHIEAEQSWKRALAYARKREQKQRIQRLLKASRMLTADVNQERSLHDVYMATPRTGPAATLQGKVAVAYIFLTDGALNSWSVRKRELAMNSWEQAESWLQKKAEQYQTGLSFSRRIFMVDKNPIINRLQVGDFDGRGRHADEVAQLVAEQFGSENILEFIEKIKSEEQADQAAIIFHLAREGRSFTRRCIYQCDNNGEFVYLLEEPKVKRLNVLNYTQAHETLHLFGADDLYNIKSARNYVVRDIMNYPARTLAANTLEPITAYAIGIENNKPVAPFEIQVY